MYKLEDSGAPIEPYLWLPSHLNLFNRFKVESWIISRQYLKNQHLHQLTCSGWAFWGSWRIGEGGRGVQKGSPSLKSVTHILQWWKLAQLYLTQRRSKKYMNHVTHPLSSADISIFSPEISKFCYIKKYRYKLYFDA